VIAKRWQILKSNFSLKTVIFYYNINSKIGKLLGYSDWQINFLKTTLSYFILLLRLSIVRWFLIYRYSIISNSNRSRFGQAMRILKLTSSIHILQLSHLIGWHCPITYNIKSKIDTLVLLKEQDIKSSFNLLTSILIFPPNLKL